MITQSLPIFPAGLLGYNCRLCHHRDLEEAFVLALPAMLALTKGMLLLKPPTRQTPGVSFPNNPPRGGMVILAYLHLRVKKRRITLYIPTGTGQSFVLPL